MREREMTIDAGILFSLNSLKMNLFFFPIKCTVSLFYALSMNYGLAKPIENFDCFLPLELYVCAFSQIDVTMDMEIVLVTSMPLKCPIHVHYASFFVMCHFLSCRTKSCDKGSTIELTPIPCFQSQVLPAKPLLCIKYSFLENPAGSV